MDFSSLTKGFRTKKTTGAASRKGFRVWWVVRLLIFTVVIFLTGLYAVFSVLFAQFFLKSPTAWTAEETPAAYGLKYSAVSFPAAEDNLAVRGWFVPATAPSDKVIIVLHGKGQNRGSYLPFGAVLAKNGYNVLLFDFRGHGETAGQSYTFGYYEQRDVAGAVTYLKRQGYQAEHMGMLGYSLGAVAGLLAFSQDDVKAMVSDSAFADLGPRLDLALSDYLDPPLEPLLLPGIETAATFLTGLDINKVRPIEAVRHLGNRHILLIHGDRDTTAPYTDSVELKNAAGDNAELWIVPGAKHALSYEKDPQGYTERVLAFFGREL